MKMRPTLVVVALFGLLGISCEMHPLPSAPQESKAVPTPQPAETPSAESPAPRYFPDSGN